MKNLRGGRSMLWFQECVCRHSKFEDAQTYARMRTCATCSYAYVLFRVNLIRANQKDAIFVIRIFYAYMYVDPRTF